VFSDQIQDIDGTPTPPTYVLKMNVIFFTSDIPWDNEAYVQVIADSLNEFSKFTVATDSVIVDVSAAIASNLTDSIAFQTWEENNTGATHNTPNSTGRQLRDLANAGVVHTGTSDNLPANTASTISLQTGGGQPTVLTVDDEYNGTRITITSGTGSGQAPRIISDYTGSNQSAVIAPDWTTVPDATSQYSITPGNVHAETQTGSYAGGAVFISPNGSTTANIGVDGTSTRPIDDGSLANARIVADARNITQYILLSGANITLDENYDGWRFVGGGSILNLGGQSISGARFDGQALSGVGTGANRIVMRGCFIGDMETQSFALLACAINGTVTMSDTGAYRTDACFGAGPNGDAIFDFGAAGTQTLVMEHWNGKFVVDNMGVGGTDSIQVDGMGLVTFNSSNTSGNAVVRGVFGIVDNSVTLTNLDEDLAFTIPKVASFTSDSAYGKDTLDAFAVAGSAGAFLKDSTTGGGGGGLSAGDATTIKDTVWQAIFQASPVAGSYIDSMVLSNELATLANITDSIWDKDTADVQVAGSIGRFIMDSSAQTSAGSVTAQNMADISDSVWAHVDTAWAASTMGDQLTDQTDTVNGMMDTLQNFPARVDLIWDEDTTGHKTDPNMGFFITQGGAATISDADMAAIADSVWQADTANHNSVTGSMGEAQDLSNFADKAAVAEAVLDTMEESTDRNIQFKSLVIDNDAGDAVQFTSSGGAGDGLQVTGQGAGAGLNAVGGSLGSGFKGTGSTGGDGMELVGGTTGDGLRAAGGATSGKGINAIGGGTGAGLNITGGTGALHSMLITTQNANGNALTLTPAGTGKAIEADIDSTAFSDDFWDAVRNLPDSTLGLLVDSSLLAKVVGSMVWGIPFVTSNDSSLLEQRKTNVTSLASSPQSAIDLRDFADDGYDPTGDTVKVNTVLSDSINAILDTIQAGFASRSKIGDTAIVDGSNITSDAYWDSVAARSDSGAAGGGGSGIDTLDEAYSERLVVKIDSILSAEHGDPSWVGISGAGSGLNAMVVGVTDTSGTDTLVSFVSVVMKDLAGNPIGETQITNSSGFTSWNVTTGDSVTVQIDARTQNNHIFPISLDTLIASTDPDSFFVANGDSILMGFDFAFPANSIPNSATVFGDIVDISGSPKQYITVYAELSIEGLATDDSNTVLNGADSTITDINGRWSMPLIWSSTVDSSKYKIWFVNNGEPSKKRQVFVADGTLQRVTLGKK